ncbi:MAG: DUF3365 domain-containing protein [Gammaproteobacteria bacterium]|nr:DUF3365 domain-containing protein [Gammaproteobacteria bacterium]MDH5593972.1 DUF3365 domain-containing protein [Gammaproteobacteria bacterium]
MKNKYVMVLAGILSISLVSCATTPKPDMKMLKQEAVSIVKKFGGTLKPQLGKALKSGGPVHAIEVCSKKAPEIADKLSAETGWSVKRVSLKARNSKTAIPDEWERKILKQFDERQASGEPAERIAYAEIVDGRYRFMKAQGVEAVCLNCHAANIKTEVEAALKQHYPDDNARGYSLGQIRGAFSLSKDL